MARTTKFNFKGDKKVAKELFGLARLQLEKLRNLMSFNKLEQYAIKLEDETGAYITASSVFGTENVEIFYPPQPAEKKEKVVIVTVPMSWDTDPPYDRDENGALDVNEDGERTHILDLSSIDMKSDPFVVGGHYFIVSVVNGTDENNRLLPAHFSVKPGKDISDDEYPGWSIKQGIRQTDGTYKIDGKSATVLLAEDVKGNCSIFAIDGETMLVRKVAFGDNTFFVTDLLENPIYYMASELGVANKRGVNFTDLGLFLGGQTELQLITTEKVQTGYSFEPGEDPTEDGYDGEHRWVYSTTTTTWQETAKVIERFTGRVVLPEVILTTVTEVKDGIGWTFYGPIWGNYWRSQVNEHKGSTISTVSGDTYRVVKDDDGSPYSPLAVKVHMYDVYTHEYENDTYNYGWTSDTTEETKTDIESYIEYSEPVGLISFPDTLVDYHYHNVYSVWLGETTESESYSFVGKTVNWYERIDGRNNIIKYLVYNGTTSQAYIEVNLEGLEKGESFTYTVDRNLVDIGSIAEYVRIFRNLYYGREDT